MLLQIASFSVGQVPVVVEKQAALDLPQDVLRRPGQAGGEKGMGKVGREALERIRGLQGGLPRKDPCVRSDGMRAVWREIRQR